MKNKFKVGDRVINTFCEEKPENSLADYYSEAFNGNIGTVVEVENGRSRLENGAWVKFDNEFNCGNLGRSGAEWTTKKYRYFFFSKDRDGVDGLKFLKKIKPYRWKKL